MSSSAWRSAAMTTSPSRSARASSSPECVPCCVASSARPRPATREATLEGEVVHLTPTEFDLLHRLAKSPHVVFARRRLLEEVWGYRGGSGERTVDSHVRALRAKLGHDVIRTVHGVGYALSRNGVA